LTIAADAERWARAGFAVENGRCSVGAVTLEFVDPVAERSEGVLSWSLAGVEAGEVDGLPSAPADDSTQSSNHPNGVLAIDHVVVLTPDLERTTGAIEGIGARRRRLREVGEGDDLLRQGFFRLGEPILEVVEHARTRESPSHPASFWGITFVVTDLDASADLLGDRLGSIKDAVQPGRRIATVRKEAGLGLPVALMTSES